MTLRPGPMGPAALTASRQTTGGLSMFERKKENVVQPDLNVACNVLSGFAVQSAPRKCNLGLE